MAHGRQRQAALAQTRQNVISPWKYYESDSKSLTENECESFQEVADHIPRGSKHEREVTA
jgi:hypothetical protein